MGGPHTAGRHNWQCGGCAAGATSTWPTLVQIFPMGADVRAFNAPCGLLRMCSVQRGNQQQRQLRCHMLPAFAPAPTSSSCCDTPLPPHFVNSVASLPSAKLISRCMAWRVGRQLRGKHSGLRQGRTRHAPGTSTSLSTGAQARSPHCITRACAAHAPQRRQTPPTKREAHTLSNGACGPAPGPSLYHPPSPQVARLRAEEKGCPSRSQVICIGIGRAAGWAGPRPRKSREPLACLAASHPSHAACIAAATALAGAYPAIQPTSIHSHELVKYTPRLHLVQAPLHRMHVPAALCARRHSRPPAAKRVARPGRAKVNAAHGLRGAITAVTRQVQDRLQSDKECPGQSACCRGAVGQQRQAPS